MANTIIIMGVSGCGKSTVGSLLAEALAIPFFDADGYHPQENVDKMQKGIPLTDHDRSEWLQTLNQIAKANEAQGAVIACSALKDSYRKQLKKGIGNCFFVFLKGSFETIKMRMEQRKAHFMPIELLQSQFETLEEPKDALTLSIKNSPETLVKKILIQLPWKN